MPSQTRSPSDITAPYFGFGVAWQNAENIGADDASYATLAFAASEYTNGINCKGFGFSVPSDATIDGIVVEIKRYTDISGLVTSGEYYLLNYPDIMSYGSPTTKPSDWPASEQYETWGGTAELWGITPTPADVNNSLANFLFGVGQFPATGSGSLYINHVRMAVYYTEAAPEPEPAGHGRTIRKAKRIIFSQEAAKELGLL